ncbi:MAG: hypothetical protein ROO76_04700 [Terriglobia bacterium]|nr:hypothetical protein [Terriglobia bacterium]
MSRRRKSQLASLALLLVLVIVPGVPAFAQLEVGENTKINLSGNVGFGYAGVSGGDIGSSHSTSFAGTGTLTGYYYHPNFLSFTLMPYYNRAQTNSDMQSIANASGFSSSASFFTGSHFPGTVFYSKDISSNGNYGLPGFGSLSSDGSSQGYGITWSALFSDLPTLTASYSSRSNQQSIIGAPGESKSLNRDFDLNSSYTRWGFLMGAYFAHLNTTASFPDFLGGASYDKVGTNTYGVTATRNIPLSGSFWSSFTHTNYTDGMHRSGTTSSNTASVGGSITPWSRFTFSSDLRYNGNLLEYVARDVVNPDNGAPIVMHSQDAKSLVSTNMGYFRVTNQISLVGNLTHREQWYDNRQYADTQYGGTVNLRYARPLFGTLRFSFSLVDTANKEGNSSLGFVGNVGMTRKFGHWDTAADFSYSQNVQTLVAMYSTSNYSYGGYVRRKLSPDSYWNASARISHSALTQREGEGNRSETFSSGIGWHRYSVSGAYSQAHGTAVLTYSGDLVPTPIGGVFTNDIVTVDGRSYTISGSAYPVSRMTLTGYYSKVKSNTSSLLNLVNSMNNGDRYAARIEYRVRKMSLIGNYNRTTQVITAANPNGVTVNSYSFTVSRWFNVF